jgi:hypothetical protein
LRLERLEERMLLSVTPGTVVVGPAAPTDPATGLPLNMLYGAFDTNGKIQNTPQVSALGVAQGVYQVPGSNALANPPANVNVPLIVNGSPAFIQSGQAAQSSDWWSNLMFRTDPTTVGTASFSYPNRYLFSEPAVLRFQNNLFDASTGDWVQGLSIFNSSTLGITPDPQGPSATTNRGFDVFQATPLTVGIGSAKRVTPTATDPGIAPLDDPALANPNGPDEARLRLRVNHYSDWGVQVVYGDGNPDVAGSQTNTLTVDMQNGSPLIDFTKHGPAPADVWLTAMGAGSTNQIWGQDIPGLALPSNILGVTSTISWVDNAGVTHQNISSYLVIAQSGSWQFAQGYAGRTPNDPRLLVDTGISDGKISVVLLPHFVGSQVFETLDASDKKNIAAMFYAAPASSPSGTPPAFNYPANNASSTRVSDPGLNQQTYNNQLVNFGYDPATSLVTTKFTVTTDTGEPMPQVLYPQQINTLLPSDRKNFLTYSLNGVAQPLEYLTLSGTALLYASPTNTFATQVTYSGILPYLPSVAAQTDPGAAEALYADAAQWFNTYLQAPDAVIGPTENTYLVGLTLLGEQLMIIDQLASPASLLSPAEQAKAASWRDRILQDLKSSLFSWFDTSTGRLFQENTKYDTVIGYPAGFGSDFSFNDHNFHYGYFLNAFADVAQFDPDFVSSLRPQIDLLVNDVANWSRTNKNLPFLREFNPWEGHSWADGLGQGGNNMESVAESIQFDSALARLGMLLNVPQWRDLGVYLYSSEVESETEYWFNASAQPDQGNFGNWPQSFVDYNLNGQPTTVTQIANPRQVGPNRELFFSDPNYSEGVSAINWLPISAQSLYLGRDEPYMERNWSQFIQDYNVRTPVPDGVYQLLVASYQALMPDQGVGLDQPGPSNALLRIDPGANTGIIPPAPDNLVNNGYRGTTRTQALNWIDALQVLGQVDPTVIATTPSYAAFIKNGQRSYVAYNPTAHPLDVEFKDAQSGAVLAVLTVQPGQMLTQLASGQWITDQLGQVTPANQGSSLFLLSSTGQNTLGARPGTAVPNAAGNPLDINTYKDTFADVPANPNGTDSYPGDGNALVFTSGPITGVPIPGGKTEMQLFLDNVLTWNNPPAADPVYGRQYGPGVVQNRFLGTPNVNIEVDYQFDDSNGQAPTFTDRIEWYTAKLTPNNQFVLYDTTVADPAVGFNQNFNAANLVNQPFEPMNEGRVRVRIWGGAVNAGMTSKDFALSVNTVPEMARTSRIILPYVMTTATGASTAPVSVSQIAAVSPVRRSTPLDALTVTLTNPAAVGGFTIAALSLTHNGQPVPLGPGVKVALLSGTTYQIQGLAASQTSPGLDVLTIDASKIRNPAGTAGSGTASVNWFLDQSPPVASLFTTAIAPAQTNPIPVTVIFTQPVTGFGSGGVVVKNAALANFRGSGKYYSFDLTPTAAGVSVSAQVIAGTVLDAAGNANPASSPLVVTVAAGGPMVVVSTPSGTVTNASPIPLTVSFSSPVSITPAQLLAKLMVANGTLSVSSGGGGPASFTFNLTRLGPGLVSVQVPAAAASDSGGNPSFAAAPFSITYDPTPPSVLLTSADSFGTFQSPIPVTVEFSEPVQGFTASGLGVTNAKVTGFSGSGARYSFSLVPLGVGQVTAQVAAGAGRDAAGNPSTASSLFSRVFEVQPLASLFSPVGHFTSSTSVPIYVQFNEPARLNPSAISVVQGSINDTVTQISPTTYLFHVTPKLPPNQQSTVVSVTLAQLGAVDAFGNATQPVFKYDFTYSNYLSLQASLTLLGSPGPYNQVQLQFNQPFVQGFDATKLQVSSNARASAFSGGGNTFFFWVSAFPTTANYDKSMTLSVTLPAGAVTGADGLPLPAPTSLTINTPTITGPTAVITSGTTHDNWSVGPVPMEVTFSEEVTGFDQTSLTPSPGATVSVPQQSSSNPAQYTFTLTPPPNATSVSVGVAPGAIKGKSSNRPLMGIPTVFNRNLVSGPIVTGVTSSFSGTALPGDLVPIQVRFSSPVIVSTTFAPPVLLLNATGPAGAAQATYVSGGSADGSSSTLVFNYVVQPGQRIARLDERSTGALTSLGQTTLISGSILDAQTKTPISTPVLFDPGAPGSLGAATKIAVGSSATGVTSVSSTLAAGTYAPGKVIPITLTFNNPVTVVTTGGVPSLALNVTSGGVPVTAVYASGTDTTTLTFNYTVQAGQNSPALDYASTTALALNGGTILITGTTNAADLTLPPPGGPGSLGTSRVIAVTDHPARVIAVWNNATNQTLGAQAVVQIFVTFDGPVTVDTTLGSPTLTLALESGTTTTASYAGGSGTTSLEFDYTVAAGQQALKLDYASSSSLQANKAVIQDALSNNANLTLPLPGGAGSLRSNNTTISANAPHVVSVTALTSQGGYGLDSSGTVNASITILVTFDKLVAVDLTKGTPTLLLNSGSGAAAVFNSQIDADTLPILKFIYTIGKGQSTPLLDYIPNQAFQLNGATIVDRQFPKVPADLTLPAPGSPASVSGSSALAVQTDATAAPIVAAVTSTAINGTYGLGDKIPVTVILGAAVMVAGNPTLQLALDGGRTAIARYVSGSGTNMLTFVYTVGAGDSAQRLDDGGFLVLNGLNVVLPAPGHVGSLGVNNRIAVATGAAPQPTIAVVQAGVPDGQYLSGAVVPIEVHFNRPVVVTGTPLLILAARATRAPVASYASGSGSDTLTFLYTVSPGQSSPRLDYFSTTALSTPTGSTITDAFNGQNAVLALPTPGLAGSLASSSLIVIGHPSFLIEVIPEATTTILDAPSVVFDHDPFTLLARVSTTDSSSSLNSGTVEFMDGQTLLGTAPVVGGVAQLRVTLPAGAHALEAFFDGGTLFAPSASDTEAALSNELSVGRSSIEIRNGQTGAEIAHVFPFGRSYEGGLASTTLDFSDDGVFDVATARARTSRGIIRIYSGKTGKLERSILAFRHLPHRGLSLSTRDVNGDGIPDIVAHSSNRRGQLVESFNGRTGAQLGSIQRIPAGPAARIRRGAR